MALNAKKSNPLLVGMDNLTTPKVEEQPKAEVHPIPEKAPTLTENIPDMAEDKLSSTEDVPALEDDNEIIHVIDRQKPGRKPKWSGVYKTTTFRLKEECYEYAKKRAYKYESMNGYINWLIEQDMMKNN